MREIKCKKCNQWSTSTLACEHCNYKFPQFKNSSKPELTSEEKQQGINKPQMSSKMKKFIDELYHSGNPFKKILYYIIMSIWSIYVGLVVLMLYLAVLGSG
ncbi:MAG: hypothetical protein ACPGU5_01470 [Lishizhenia sp.]